jgi:hypothetical protein
MITFKEHMSVCKGLSVDDDGKVSIENVSSLDKLDLIDRMQSIYPIKESKSITPYIKENFKVHKGVMDLVLGQFIMVEQILTGKSKFNSDEEMELAILELVLRPKHHKEFDNVNPIEEQKNREKILNSPVQDLYNVLQRYLGDREEMLFKKFKGVFYEVNEETEEVEEKVEDTGEAGAQFHSQWYWYSIVRLLAHEDITRYSEIYMLGMSEVLPEMSYLAQKNKVESAQRRQDAALSKIVN